MFIGNYVAGLAVVVTFALLWQKIEARQKRLWRLVPAGFALIAIIWGFVECHYTVRVLDEVNVTRDEALPVARRLTQLAIGDPDKYKRVVLYLGIAEGDDLPTIAPQPVLWARHQHVFSGVSWDENKKRYYQQLYYQGVIAQQLAEGMKSGDDFVSMIALFGWGRHTDRLVADYKPLTFKEIEAEAAIFDEYVKTFDPAKPSVMRLDYLIAPAEPAQFYDKIDRWYERDAGEIYGKYVLYRLKLR